MQTDASMKRPFSGINKPGTVLAGQSDRNRRKVHPEWDGEKKQGVLIEGTLFRVGFLRTGAKWNILREGSTSA